MMQLQEAEMAYRNCVRDRFNPYVWEKLMNMYTNANYLSEPIVCAAQLCNYHILHFDERVNVDKEPPPLVVQNTMCKLIAQNGMNKVRSALKDPSSGNVPQSLVAFLDRCCT